MTEKELNDLSAYFDGYGSPHDDTILKLILEYKKQAERAQELEKLQSESKINLWARVGNLRVINESLTRRNKHLLKTMEKVMKYNLSADYDYEIDKMLQDGFDGRFDHE